MPEAKGWLRVIDEAMVTHHIGVAEPSDSYEVAKQKMNSLLCAAQDIGAYFAKKAAQEQAEPVAWMDIARDGTRLSVRMWSDGNFEEVPLYLAPPQRRPLTDEEIDRITDAQWAVNNHKPIYAAHLAYARAIEKAHGIE